MKKNLFLLLLFVMLAMFTACNNNKSTEEKTDTADTTAVAEKLEQQEVDNVLEIINTISATLDSIQLQEDVIFNMKEGTPKEQVIAKLKAFQTLLAQKQNEIGKLTMENKSNKKSLANLNNMVKHLQSDVEAKAKQIAELQKLVEKKDASISSLRYNLNAAEKESEYLKDQNFEQDQQLNSVYYVIGTKSELKEKGMLKGGFLSKKRADYTNLDKSNFTKRDMRGFTKLIIESKKPKLITEKPASSYTITKNADGTSTLEITDAKAFWNASPFLIIQK